MSPKAVDVYISEKDPQHGEQLTRYLLIGATLAFNSESGIQLSIFFIRNAYKIALFDRPCWNSPLLKESKSGFDLRRR